jgi:hypothetical protein
MKIRRTVQVVLYIFLFFGAISGCNVVTGAFRHQEVQVAPDYSALQRQAEYFTTLFLDWKKPLEERKTAMAEIAPSVVPYLVSGKQSVLFVEAGTPVFSGERVFVDVIATTRATAFVKVAEKETEQEVSRRYKLKVYFVSDGNGRYVVERMPLQNILPAAVNDPRPVMTEEQEAVATTIKPTLSVFLPALMSGDLRSVQTLLKTNTEIVPFHGEYEYLDIQDIRVRVPSDSKVADYAIDVVIKVKDVELKQSLSMQVYLWVKQEGDKFYIVRANV